MRIAIKLEGNVTLYFYPFSWFMRSWNYNRLPGKLYNYLKQDIAIKGIAIER